MSLLCMMSHRIVHRWRRSAIRKVPLVLLLDRAVVVRRRQGVFPHHHGGTRAMGRWSVHG